MVPSNTCFLLLILLNQIPFPQICFNFSQLEVDNNTFSFSYIYLKIAIKNM